MMPAAMLKRLEREAVEQERRKVERRRHATRDSPIKPGKAVISRGQGGVNIQDLLENVASKEEVYEDAAVLSASRTPQPERQQQLIVVSEDESSQSSQAHEDNVGEQSLTRLYDGDFESIVAGRHALDRPKWNEATMKRPRSKSHQKHPRRPALGLVKRIAMSLSKGDRGMMQTRLDFPVNDRSTVHYAKARKHKQKDGRRSRRPAIQLDDHIIFATTDFAFNTQEEEQRPGLPRPFKRTISKVISEPDALDNGIGKARSWANFDNFPIDFGISPLPSGLYCSRESLVGNGDLARLVALLQGRGSESEEVLGCSAYSVELRIDMTPGALSAVISMLFEGIGQSVVALANDPGADVPDLAPLTFFGRYFSSQASVSDDIDGMRSLCRPAVGKLSDKLNEVTLTRAKHSRSVRDWLIRLRWSILEMTMRLNLMASPDETIDDLVDVSGAAMIQQLLGGGFDKTIRPLKSILRSESGSPEVSDLSVTIWIAVIHSLSAWDQRRSAQSDTFSKCLDKALDSCFRLDQTGPIAAERIWFVVFGLSALSQFDVNGRIVANFTPAPRWSLVRRAVSLIKISHNEEAEEKAHLDQLRGRDRYIKTILARCVRLSSVWRWNFDRESFSVATKDLGAIFKDRQHRNLPTEPPVDYPDWVTSFDISLTAAEDTTQESAFELYLRSVCVAASDIISSARDMSEAQQAEKDVQRLIMSIIPVSPVKFHRILPPTSRQLGQLINRYSTMVAACYFSPSLLSWLLANSRKWAPFEHADFESRQISIRGLMYLSVTCRHHQQPLAPVVTRLADILKVLQFELDHCGKPSAPAQAPSRVEITRTMVLVVSCFRQMIIHHSFNAQQQAKHVYPDPCLLHESRSRGFTMPSWRALIINRLDSTRLRP